MSDLTPRAGRFTSAIGDDAVHVADGILISPALGAEAGESMSAYTAVFRARTSAELPAPYREGSG